MNLKFPVRIPPNRKVLFQQGFIPGVHEAVDVICGTAIETYGTPVVCPFPSGEMITRQIDEAFGEKGSMFQLKYKDPQGNEYIMGGLHCSYISAQRIFVEGDTIANIGNNGIYAVNPHPTIFNPYNGTHLHLTLVVNGKIVAPYVYFDINNPYRGEDTGFEADKPPFVWSLNGIKKKLDEIFALIFKNK
jgi:hypothetical protein